MPKETTKYKYPLLMKGIVSGRIVNMISHGKGTVVGGGHGRHSYTKLGRYSDDWAMSSFKPYKG